MLDRRVSPKVSRRPERPAGLDGLDDRCAAAEERVPVARFGLPGHGVTELLIGVAVGGIDVVAVEAIRPLHDVAIEVDHRMAVPAHRRPPSREGVHSLPGIELPYALTVPLGGPILPARAGVDNHVGRRPRNSPGRMI